MEATPRSMTAEKSRGWLEIGWFSDQIDRADAKIWKKFEQASERTNERKSKNLKNFQNFSKYIVDD